MTMCSSAIGGCASSRPSFLVPEFAKRPLRPPEAEEVVDHSLSGERRARESGAENALGRVVAAANKDNGDRPENSPTETAPAKLRPRTAYAEAPAALATRASVNHTRHRRTWRHVAAPRRRRFTNRSRGS